MTNILNSRAVQTVTRDAHLSRLVVILIGIIAFFAIMKPQGFLGLRTWQSMAVQFPEFGLLALGVMLAMMTSGIDLSVVGIANMTAIGAAVLMLQLAPEGASGGQVVFAIAVAIAFALAAGALAGAFNGWLVSKVKIPPILVTLGTFELFTGIAIIITAGKPISGLPDAYGEVFAGKLFGVVPVPLLVFIGAVIIVGLVLNKTAFGKKILMLGTNETAARLSGLNTDRLLVKTYMFSGTLAALGGLVMLANYNSAKADYGSTYTLLTVLIVVLGGLNPNGGSGRLLGVVLAVVILQILSSGLNMFPEISNFYRPLIWGGVLLAVMVANYFSKDGPVLRRSRRKESSR